MPDMHQDIIKLLGLEELPYQEQLRIIDRATEILEYRVLERVLPELTDEQQTELKQAIEEEGAGLAYLEPRVEGFEEIVKEEVKKVRKEVFARKEQAREDVERELEEKGL